MSERPEPRASAGPKGDRASSVIRAALLNSVIAAIVSGAFAGFGGLVRGIEARHAPNGPFVVVDAWGTDGHLAVLAFSGVAFVVFEALVLLFARRAKVAAKSRAPSDGSRPLDRFALAAGAIGLAAGLASWGCSFSSDTYAYAAYGELARLGLNPYVGVPGGELAARDALIHGAWTHWPSGPPPCVYGPGFVAIAHAFALAAVAANGGANVGALSFAIGAFRAASLPSLAIAALLLGRALSGRRGAGVAVAAFVANPVVLWAALEGHNDTLALMAALAGIVAVRAAARAGIATGAGLLAAAGAALTALAAEVKATALLALPFAIVAGRAGPLRRAALAGAALGLAIVFGPGLEAQIPAFEHLATHSAYHPPAYSLHGWLSSAFASLEREPIPTPRETDAAASIVLLACGFIAFVAARRLAQASRSAFPGDARRSALALLGSAAFVALPNPQPWYAVWFACLAAGTLVRDDGGLEPVALGLWAATFCLALRYLPDAAGALDGAWRSLVVISPLLPIGAGLLAAIRARKRFRPLLVKADA